MQYFFFFFFNKTSPQNETPYLCKNILHHLQWPFFIPFIKYLFSPCSSVSIVNFEHEIADRTSSKILPT